MSVLLIPAVLGAQGVRDRLESHLRPYGFFSTFATFDSRESVTGGGGLFYCLPMDKELNLEGKDLNYNPSFKMASMTTRLGLDASGYQYGSLKVLGKVEADFSLLNGGTATFRLRQAWAKLLWDDLGRSDYSLSVLVGQAWNPMAVDRPYSVNLEQGAPFNPFARSPQLMVEVEPVSGLSFAAGAIYPVQYLPTGPVGPSQDYVKHGLIPELYAGAAYSAKGFTAKVGADFLSLRPRTRAEDSYLLLEKGTPVRDKVAMVSPMVYLEYDAGAVKVNAKSVLASGGDHLCLMGGYARFNIDDNFQHKYTPLRSTVSFVSASVGSKWQLLCMLGYMRALGTADPLMADSDGHPSLSDIYYSKDGFKNISQMVRATPTLAYNSGKLTLALEYNCSAVEYGDISTLDTNALCTTDLHWILNHRLQAIFQFCF